MRTWDVSNILIFLFNGLLSIGSNNPAFAKSTKIFGSVAENKSVCRESGTLLRIS